VAAIANYSHGGAGLGFNDFMLAMGEMEVLILDNHQVDFHENDGGFKVGTDSNGGNGRRQ
jgi:hypothetical protein